MGPGKLVRHMQNPSYTYDEYLICIGLGPSISSVICKNPSYSGPSYPSSPVVLINEWFRTLRIIFFLFLKLHDFENVPLNLVDLIHFLCQWKGISKFHHHFQGNWSLSLSGNEM